MQRYLSIFHNVLYSCTPFRVPIQGIADANRTAGTLQLRRYGRGHLHLTRNDRRRCEDERIHQRPVDSSKTYRQKRAIHRITINGTNIINAMIYEKLEGEGRWRAIMQIQNNESPIIKMRVSGVVTDAIRIYISGTTDDEKQASRYDPRRGAIVPQIKLGKAFIHELEVYGLVSKGKQ